MRAAFIALALVVLAGCTSTRTCKKGTLLVEAHYPVGVEKITIDVQVGTTAESGVLDNPAGATSGTAEVDFTHYNEGERVTISLRAYLAGTVVAGHTETITLSPTCTKVVFDLDGAAVDGGVDGFGGDQAVPACGTGQHYCGACVADDSVTACGASCAVCTQTTHGTATCTTGMCGFSCEVGYAPSNTGCDIAPPQNIAPASGALSPSAFPYFAWTLAAGTTGAHLEVCVERTCAQPILSMDIDGSTFQTGSPLPSDRILYWHVAGRIGTTVGTTYSPLWELRGLNRQTPTTTKLTFGKNTDINGDGRSDVVVGDDAIYPPAQQRMGDIHVHYGVNGGIATSSGTKVGGGNATGGFAHSVATLGDVDGDGYADVLVGSMGEGKAYFFKGSSNGLVAASPTTLAPPASAPNADFGTHVAAAGDVNGDGFADAIVGATAMAQGAWVFYGGPGGLPALPSATLTVPTGSMWFGTTLAPAGDVNRDGYADILVGDFIAAKVYVYFGGPSGIAATASQTLLNPGTGSFGDFMCGGFDITDDGYADIAVASQSSKRVYVFRGTSTGVENQALNTLTAPGPSAFAGGVDVGGDVNGDGFPELLVVGLNSTAQYVYLGSVDGFTTPPITLTAPSNSGAQGILADVDDDGYSDIIIGNPSGTAGQALFYKGGSAVPTTVTTAFTDSPVTGRYGVTVQ